MDHVASSVADRSELEAWEARFEALGVEHSEITSSVVGELIAFRDPDNIAFEVYADFPSETLLQRNQGGTEHVHAHLAGIPPDPTNEALFGEVKGLRQTPIPVIGFDGPEGHLGPESAGAVLVLHMTTIDDERTQRFWRQVALTCKAASESRASSA